MAVEENQRMLPREPILSQIRTSTRFLLPFVGLIAIIIFFQIISGGRLITVRNGSVLLNQIFTIAIGSTGVLFVMAQGNIDFSIGGIAGLSAAVAATVAPAGTAYVLPVALLIGLAVGSMNGIFNARLGIPSFIGTLAVSFVLKGVVVQVLGSGSKGIPLSMLPIDNLPLKLAVLVGVLLLGGVLFEYTKLGKHSKAIGSQPEVAKQAGVNVPRTKTIAFVLAGLVAGLAGFFDLVRSGTASTTTGLGFELNVLNALLLGGIPITGGATAKFRGVIVGSATIAVLTNGMTLWGVGIITQQLVKGLIFIAAVSLSFDRRNTAVIK